MPTGVYQRTEEHKKTWFKKGQKSWNKGTKGKFHTFPNGRPPFSEATLQKMRMAKLGKKQSKETIEKRIKRGKDHYNWQNGKSYEPYSVDWTKTLKRAIRERDHYTCQLCGEKQEEITFSVHHIDYDKKNCNSDNLITLCRKCHIKTNYNREYWTNYFNGNK